MSPPVHGIAAWRCAIRITIPFVVVTSSTLPAPMSAQSRHLPGVIDALVVDSALRPIGGARAWIVGTRLQVTSNSDGRFRIVGLDSGTYFLVIRHIGFAPLSAKLSIAVGDTLRSSFELQRSAVSLDTVTVLAPHQPSPLDEFEQRRKFGQGQFMTQTDIERLNIVALSGVLRTFQSVSVTGSVLNRRSLPTLSCPFQFFVDGVAVPPPRQVDDELPSPNELAGIEVYANTATIPLQYKTFGGDGSNRRGGAACGVILLWTKRG